MSKLFSFPGFQPPLILYQTPLFLRILHYIATPGLSHEILGLAVQEPDKNTFPGTNMEVKNGPLEDHFPLQTGGFPLPR